MSWESPGLARGPRSEPEGLADMLIEFDSTLTPVQSAAAEQCRLALAAGLEGPSGRGG
jgi:hypothetical protein